MAEFAFAAGAIFAASFVQGLTGFGSGMIALTLLALMWDIQQVVAITAVFSIVLCVYLAWSLREHIRFREIWPMLLGAVIGVPIGVTALTELDPRYIKGSLGIFLLIYALWSLFSREGTGQKIRRVWAFPTGLFSGILSGAFNTSGPPVIIYGTERGWVKDRFRATLQGYFLLTTTLSTTGYVTTGLITAESLKLNAMLLPALALGAWGGQRASQYVNPETFRKVVLWALLGMGVFYGVRFFAP